MRVGALWSGGKDSSYAAYVTSRTDQLACLITILPPSADSYMFHFPNVRWTKLQASAMGLPQVTQETSGVKEEELNDLRDALLSAKADYSLDAVCTGALASDYQRIRVERVCGSLGLGCLSPLWHADPETHLRNIVRDRFLVQVVSVSALGLDAGWLGRVLDEATIDELVKTGAKYGFHIGFEGGEAETFVLDCPLFSKKIEILSTQTHWKGDSGYLDIVDARLVAKPS